MIRSVAKIFRPHPTPGGAGVLLRCAFSDPEDLKALLGY